MDDATIQTIAQVQGGKLPPENSLAKIIRDALTDDALRNYVSGLAEQTTIRRFGHGIFIRGLVEVTNYCRNNCLYCGIRKDNATTARYRLDNEVILQRCREGHASGFRTFVLQGGEDPAFNDKRLSGLVALIRKEFADSAITLSFGERSRESYQRLFDAGANRYLLRHESADAGHYARLHPQGMALATRMRCLYDLKDIGYQVGCGVMVGVPFQRPEHLARDLAFMHGFRPEMVGIGPFIPHEGTPLGSYAQGPVSMTVFFLGLVRLMLPGALIPATTALATAAANGRERGILAGANVVMPNLSPREAREKYTLYMGKLSSGEEAAEHLEELGKSLEKIGRRIDFGRGDHRGYNPSK